MSRRRGRPGWTRYQCPSSMASVIAPMNAAPTRVRDQRDRRVAAGVERGGDQPDGADEHRDEVERRRELRAHRLVDPVVVGGSDGAVDAGHRRDALAAPIVLGRGTAHAPALRRTIETPSATAQADHHADRRGFADGNDAEREAGGQRTGGEEEVDDAQQPAVAEADDAAAGGEPAEQACRRSPTAGARWRRRG